LFAASFEVLLYDLTSTYFESPPPDDETDKRRHGYSRDKRRDCVQVVIALIVTTEGFPLAYHIEWHLRDALAPLLFHDTELDTARTERPSPVAKTEPSETVKAKKATKRSADGQRVMSFGNLIAHVPSRRKHRFNLYSKPTPLQEVRLQAARSRPNSGPVAKKPDRKIVDRVNSIRASKIKTSV
jgi:hypothetical protein